MSSLLAVIVSLSWIGLLIISIYRFMKMTDRNVRSFIVQIFVLGICFAFLYIFFLSSINLSARAAQNEIYFVIVLYMCMLLGMLAQYLHAWLTKPKKERKKQHFDGGLFIAPVFASPIIFIPLLAALQNTVVDLQNLTTAKLMIFFVAFENGFFWKEYFDNRQELKKESKDVYSGAQHRWGKKVS